MKILRIFPYFKCAFSIAVFAPRRINIRLTGQRTTHHASDCDSPVEIPFDPPQKLLPYPRNTSRICFFYVIPTEVILHCVQNDRGDEILTRSPSHVILSGAALPRNDATRTSRPQDTSLSIKKTLHLLMKRFLMLTTAPRCYFPIFSVFS